MLVMTLWAMAGLAAPDPAEIAKKAQETRITLTVRDSPVEDVLDQIALLSGIAVTKVDLPTNAPAITVALTNATVDQALKWVAQSANLSCSIVDGGFLMAAKLNLSQIPKGPDNMISWQDAKRIIAQGDVQSVMQQHNRQVAIKMADGTRFLTTSPKTDEIWAVIKAAGKQGKIIFGTE